MGRGPPSLTRWINSVASSIMVISAPKSVSKTLSKPRRRRAATILPSTLVPMGISKHSPRVARIDGAVWTMTIFSGSLMASRTFWHSSFSCSAPVGQATMHWPQLTQVVSERGRSKAQAIWVSKPRLLGPMTPTCCCSQAATQRRHRIHLALSRIRWLQDSSTMLSGTLPSNRSSCSTPSSWHRVCSSQVPLRLQERQ